MAGAKETPRQRMIGMMYLVLTALLALQIKDSVLEKFILIESGLETSNAFYKGTNEGIVGNIEKAAADQGNKEQDVAVVNAAKQVHAKTIAMIDYLDQLKTDIGLESAGGSEDKVYKRSTLKKYEEPSRYLVNQGKADELKQRLDDYNTEIQAILSSVKVNKNWESLALSAEDIDFYKNNAEEKGKDYAHFNFYKSPLASVLAQLTFYKNQIYGRESEALSALGGQVGAASVKGFDLISGTVLPVSNLVTAGTEFEAELFLTAANSALTPQMTMGNSSLEVDANGRGKIKFKATASEAQYDDLGLAKKTFTAEIKYIDGGEEKTIPITHEYTVAKPTIQVGLNAVSSLYLNCANNLKIDVPSLGAAYNPSFDVKGGKGIKGSARGEVVIVPNQRNVNIGVSSSGVYIGAQAFQARTVPLPTFKLSISGKEYDATQGLTSVPSQVDLLLTADADFRQAYRQDARFYVTKGEVRLARGRRAVRTIKIDQRTTSVDLSAIRSQAKKGDLIVVKIEEITRYNFENQPEKFLFKEDRVMSINQ